MYRISINNSDGFGTQWWRNLVNHISVLYKDKGSTFNEMFKFELKQYNAVDVPGTPYIDFETEEDIVIFKLKFGS